MRRDHDVWVNGCTMFQESVGGRNKTVFWFSIIETKVRKCKTRNGVLKSVPCRLMKTVKEKNHTLLS